MTQPTLKTKHALVILFVVNVILLKAATSYAWRSRTDYNPLLLVGLRGGVITSPILSPELNLTVHDDILTKEECNFLIRLAQPLLQASKVGRPPKVEPSLRISLSCKLPRLPYPQLWSVEEKLARAAGIPLKFGEDLQVGAYQPGMYYGLHCDERPGGRPNGGGRLATALAYLNTLDPNLATGGETLFTGQTFSPNPDFPISQIRVSELKRLSNLANDCVMIEPLQGRVITFRNMASCHGVGSKPTFVSTSTHGACPVVSVDPEKNFDPTSRGATKFVVQQWFGMGEYEVMMGRHPNLICHLGLGVADSYAINPRANLASRDGYPEAQLFQTQQVPFIIPSLKATRLKGTDAKITWESSNPEPNVAMDKGLSIGFWLNRKSGRRLLQIGPYEWQVDNTNRRLLLKNSGGRTIDCQVDIPIDQWCHLSFVMAPSDSSETHRAIEIYMSLPGKPPQPPKIVLLEEHENLEFQDTVTIGGSETDVDMIMCDLYVINDNLQGRGHAFAHAVVSYDPQQGL